MVKPLPPDLIAMLRYEPATGFFFWAVSDRYRVAGARADLACPQGYRRVAFCDRYYQAHRLAWAIMEGYTPPLSVDHINRDRSDNSWSNLRLATTSQNAANRPAAGDLPKGVTRLKSGRYQAQIKHMGVGRYLGVFRTAQEAHEAYLAAAKDTFGEYARAA